MKIIEIIAIREDLYGGAGEGGVGVGNAGSETGFMHGAPPDTAHPRKDDRIPQVGYGIKIGRHAIPTARYNSANDQGTSDQVIGG